MNSEFIWQILRYALIAGGGYLTKKGFVDNDTASTAIGALGTLFTVGWGIYVKHGTKAVPVAVADKPSVPTVSGATGQINSGPGSNKA